VIYLTTGEPVLVDTADVEMLSTFTWSPLRRPHTTYAKTRVKDLDGQWRTVLMHRLLLGEPASDVDHRNHNGLDNRRANLRLASRGQNLAAARPRGRFKGVQRANSRNGWTARGQHNGVAHHLGTFATEEEAARAYDAWASVAHGEFAFLNFPNTQDQRTSA